MGSQEIAQALAGAAVPAACAEQLVALANAAGGHDNSTALVVFVRAATPDETERIPVAGEDGEAGSVSAIQEREGSVKGSVEEQR